MVGVVRSGAMSMRLSLGGTSVEAVVRHLNDGGLLIQVRWTCSHQSNHSCQGLAMQHQCALRPAEGAARS